MDSKDLLEITRSTPGENTSWLKSGWMAGSCIGSETRAGIVDWLIQVQQYLGLGDTCLHSAVANFDLALTRVDWDQGEIQLVALAALQAAAKMEEDAAPAPSLLLPLAGDVYTKQDLARIELELLQALDWQVRQTTAATFLQFYADIAGKGRKPMFKMARALLDLCLAQDWYGTRSPSYLAAACLGAAGCLTGQPWCDQLTLTTGFTWTKLTEGLHAVLSAAVADQGEGFEEKHGKAGRNLIRLQDGIQNMMTGLQATASIPA